MYGKQAKRCSACQSEHQGSHPAYCPPCYAAKARDWRAKNPEKSRKIVRDYQLRNPEKTKRNDRRCHLKSVYGITLEDYERMLVEQGGGCGVCGSMESGGPGKHFHIDHCHQTRKVRGLLCCNCNFVIGHSLDSAEILRKAAVYLERI